MTFVRETNPLETLQCGKFAIPVLMCDNQLLVVVKPCNMPVQADRSGDMDLLSALKVYVARRFNKPGAAYLGLVHRLDRPVGGVMVFARTSKAANRLTSAFAAHEIEKKYLAVAQGTFKAPLTLVHHLLKDPSTGTVSAVDARTPGAKEARLVSRPLCSRQGTTLTEVTLQTGRAHQIRVQHMAAGYPLWGDHRYGGGQSGQQIALWAHRLSLVHPTQKTELCFQFLPPAQGGYKIYADILEDMRHGG